MHKNKTFLCQPSSEARMGFGWEKFICAQSFLHCVWQRSLFADIWTSLQGCWFSSCLFCILFPCPISTTPDPALVEFTQTTSFLNDEPSPRYFFLFINNNSQGLAFKFCQLETLISLSASKIVQWLCIANIIKIQAA